MNDCATLRDSLQAYLDGQLSATERQAVEAHLAACGACRQALGSFQRLFAALDEPELPRPAPGFPGRVMARVAAARRRRRRWQAMAAAAAVLVLTCLGALWASAAVTAETWSPLADAFSLDVWQSVSDAVSEAGSSVATAGESWLARLPGGPALVAGLLALLGFDLALAYRWRVLARRNFAHTARTPR